MTLQRLRASLADRYRIERELGQGGMATVYLAEDLKHQRKVAVKVLRPELAATLGPERFAREIAVAARLQHPHILGLLDSGDAEGFFYYVMPYVEGETLRDRLTRGGELPVPDAVRLLGEIAEALAVAHKAGVVHRDIKPENILLSGRHALVMDFGVAKAVSEASGRQQLTTAGVALGTPAYMAPEQASADPQMDGRVDLYALGVLGYEMLTGHTPFHGLTPQQTLAAHVTQAPTPVGQQRVGLSQALEAVVMRCLAKRPADRFQTADELVAVLEPLATPSGGTTPTMTAPVQMPGRSRLRSRAMIVGGALIAGAAIVLAVRGWAGHSSGPGGPKSKTLAVVPFENETGDTSNAYLGSGLAEDLVTALGRVPGLEVKSPSAARHALAQPGATLASVGTALGTEYIVEGSLRRLGELWRVTARAVRPADEVTVWSESFDRNPKELVNLAPDIAVKLGTALFGNLGQGTRAAVAERPTTNPEAYEAYLRGNFAVAQRSREMLQRALAEYRRALDLDPSFAAARARTGFVLSLLVDFGWLSADETGHSTVMRGLATVDSALRQDSTLADSWLARCSLLWEDFGLGGDQISQARSACERAAGIAPGNAEVQNRLGWVLREYHDIDGARSHARLALRADPQWQVPHWLLSLVAWESGDFRVARAEWDTVGRLAPTSITAGQAAAFRGRLQLLQGDTLGVGELARLSRQRGYVEGATLLEGLLWAKRGRRDSAAVIARRFERGLVGVKGRTYSGIQATLIWLALGDSIRALQALERRPLKVVDLLAPELDLLYGNARYVAAMSTARRRVGTDDSQEPR
jgi:TolB-like protein/tRNA A-37 threonylcarbamoyl transferase component Bud32